MHSAVFQQVDSRSLTSFVSRMRCEHIEWSIYLEPETHCGDDLSSSAICKRKKKKSMVKFKTLIKTKQNKNTSKEHYSSTCNLQNISAAYVLLLCFSSVRLPCVTSHGSQATHCLHPLSRGIPLPPWFQAAHLPNALQDLPDSEAQKTRLPQKIGDKSRLCLPQYGFFLVKLNYFLLLK